MLERFVPELAAVARFYDARLVGDLGPLGFRRTAELGRILACIPALVNEGLLAPGRSSFIDLGCGDGRVNVLMSFLTRVSVGVELDEWTLEEGRELRVELDALLRQKGLRPVPENVHLFRGDASDEATHETIRHATGVALEEIDLFYTFPVGHDDHAALIAARGRPGGTFLVYGVNRVFPRHEGLDLLDHLSPPGGAFAVYRKPG
jgi:SAM-dependent methyltransferase